MQAQHIIGYFKGGFASLRGLKSLEHLEKPQEMPDYMLCQYTKNSITNF
jgi:hypothetical protein